MMIGSYPYLVNPSGAGGLYAAAVASQPVQPVAPVPGQTNNAFIKFGGALSGAQSGGGDAASAAQSGGGAYRPGSALNITA
jgi:hypothetical protein